MEIVMPMKPASGWCHHSVIVTLKQGKECVEWGGAVNAWKDRCP
jgi:hypothetical protein